MFGVEYSNSYMKQYKTDFKRTGLCENEGRKDMFYLTTYSTYILFMVICGWTYVKGPLR